MFDEDDLRDLEEDVESWESAVSREVIDRIDPRILIIEVDDDDGDRGFL